MKKCIIAMVFAITLIWGVIIPLQADSDYESDLTQLREVTYQLIEQRSMFQDFSEDTTSYSDVEIKLDRIRELVRIFVEAQSIVTGVRDLDRAPRVIVGFGPPQYVDGIYNDIFTIWVTYERYLEFEDLISDFTGIPKENMYLWVSGIGYIGLGNTIGSPVEIDWCPDEAIREASMRTIPTDEDVERFLEERNRNNAARSYIPGLFPPGTHIRYRHPNSGSAMIDMGTLGHPRNATGTTAFGTSHGIVPVGAEVFTNTGTFIGIVGRSVFDPLNGIDVSYIRVSNGRVLSSVHGIGNITQFFAPATVSSNLITAVTRRGNRTGIIGQTNGEAYLQTPSGAWHTYRNVIISTHESIGGDSGSALVTSQGRVYGTLIGGRPNLWTIFSQATRYQHIQ